jgi:hypothetical protein
MRLLTAAFVSHEEFLSHYRDQDETGAIFYRTRTELVEDEAVLLEVTFPGLPNRALVRGLVSKASPGRGAWIRVRTADASTLQFLLQLARGEVVVTPALSRGASRYPAELPVDCKIVLDDGTTRERIVSRTVDLGAGGAFVRALAAPPVGARVTLSLGPSDDESIDAVELEGYVAWTREGAERGFAVRFLNRSDEDVRLLRTALRKASESGKIAFA